MKADKDKTVYKPLDEYEKDLRDAVNEADSFKRPKNYKTVLADAIIAANNTSAKSKTVNIRITEKDLNKLKTRAEEVDIPYHTLINSLLHKYVKGEIKIII